LLCCFVATCTTSALPAPRHIEPEVSFQVLLDASEADVLKAVQQVVDDPIVHGTYSYEKEKTLTGAHPADSSALLQAGPAPAKTLYKVAENVLSPRYFKNTGDIGTITVRYMVRGVSPTKTNLQIAAVFYDARHQVHWSQGEVESAEYALIQQHLREQDAMRQAAKEAQQRNDEARKAQADAAAERPNAEPQNSGPQLAAAADSTAASSTPEPSTAPDIEAQTAEQQLEARVKTLRRQVEKRVKANGTPLKSAPFQGATTLQKLPAQAEVVVLILTPYWYGVETQNGQRGWIHHSQLEPLP
jgi:hypothetical protein